MWERWDSELPSDQLELRYEDLWGDAFQVDMSRTIIQTLDMWRPRWREQHW